MNTFKPSTFTRLNSWRRSARIWTEKNITHNYKIHFFWWRCLPDLLVQRLNEYGTGICILVLAYERYVNVCHPHEVSELLTDSKRIKIYFVMTLTIISFTVADAYNRFVTDDWVCDEAPTFGSKRDYRFRFIISLLSGTIFSYIPAFISIFLYLKVGKILISSKTRVQRNMNLVLAFSVNCFVWVVSLCIKMCQDVSELYLELYVPLWDRYKYPTDNNIFAATLLSFAPCFTSILSPFVLIIVQKNYRKPMIKIFKILKLCK